jgi:hypothetical protein
MTDVDAIRWMASEHDLEFVDLDTYGVDAAASEILPADLARLHHVVAVKRKFGTPVIATSAPDDLDAQDTLRTSIGRDFISVVASPDQIDEYLDKLFGPDGEAAPAGRPDRPSRDLPVTDDSAGPEDPPTGIGSEPKPLGIPDPEQVDLLQTARNVEDSLRDSLPTLESPEPPPPPPPPPPLPTLDLPDLTVARDPTAEHLNANGSNHPDTSSALVPDLGDIQPDLDNPHAAANGTSSTSAFTAGEDELAELARSVETEDPLQAADSADSTDLAADLVAEAVATFQEQQEEERGDIPVADATPDTALFPPLAKALVEGDRVQMADMENVLEEHARTNQSVARILTARKLVTEADLMWGMAQEMGLEFVDLDIVGVDFTEAGSIPETTARHHNVIVIANDNGTPVVAASNPTDVFAMDDLRTIMGRNFIVVVATRTQITAYIGRAFNSGGDAADMAMEASLGFDGPRKRRSSAMSIC